MKTISRFFYVVYYNVRTWPIMWAVAKKAGIHPVKFVCLMAQMMIWGMRMTDEEFEQASAGFRNETH